jgi:hypothetical protein
MTTDALIDRVRGFLAHAEGEGSVHCAVPVSDLRELLEMYARLESNARELQADCIEMDRELSAAHTCSGCGADMLPSPPPLCEDCVCPVCKSIKMCLPECTRA